MCVFNEDQVNFFLLQFYIFSQKEKRILTPIFAKSQANFIYYK